MCPRLPQATLQKHTVQCKIHICMQLRLSHKLHALKVLAGSLTEPKSLGFSAPLGPPLKATGNPPPMGPAKGCPPLSAPFMAGGACEVSTGRMTRCTVLPSVTSAWQEEFGERKQCELSRTTHVAKHAAGF